MLRTDSEHIDGRDIAATQWTATQALEMKLRLAVMAGPALKDTNLTKLVNATTDDKVKALCSIFDKVDPVKTTQLIKDILNGVSINEKRMLSSTINSFFGPDDLYTMYKIVFFVLRLNFNIENFVKTLDGKGAPGEGQ